MDGRGRRVKGLGFSQGQTSSHFSRKITNNKRVPACKMAVLFLIGGVFKEYIESYRTYQEHCYSDSNKDNSLLPAQSGKIHSEINSGADYHHRHSGKQGYYQPVRHNPSHPINRLPSWAGSPTGIGEPTAVHTAFFISTRPGSDTGKEEKYFFFYGIYAGRAAKRTQRLSPGSLVA